jgi:acyl carrier protein
VSSAGPLPDPQEVVAGALRRPRESLTEDSAMYREHGWDSYGHLSVILAIEKALGVSIDNDEAWGLKDMRAISEFFARHRADAGA